MNLSNATAHSMRTCLAECLNTFSLDLVELVWRYVCSRPAFGGAQLHAYDLIAIPHKETTCYSILVHPWDGHV